MHDLKEKLSRGAKSPYFEHRKRICNFEGRYARRAEEYTGAASCLGVIGRSPRQAARAFVVKRKKWSIVPISLPSPSLIEERFNALAEQWRNETGHYSILARRYLHPAYNGILAMGPGVVPIILRELAHRPDRWFSALSTLTGADPSRGATTFEEAVDAWLDWGRKQGLL
jgi:hypothetical protein